MHYNIGAYYMLHLEFKELCHEAWNEKFNFFCIDMIKNKNDGKYRRINENKNTYLEFNPESEAF